MPVYTWLDPQRTSYGLGYGLSYSLSYGLSCGLSYGLIYGFSSEPGQTRPRPYQGQSSSSFRFWWRNLQWDGMVVIIIIFNIRSGSRLCHQVLEGCSYTLNTFIC